MSFTNHGPLLFLTANGIVRVQELSRVQANHAAHLENCCYAQKAKRTVEELPYRVDGRQELMFLHCPEANNVNRHILLHSSFSPPRVIESWSKPVSSWVYQLGSQINFQVSAFHLPHGAKVYISSCFAAPANDLGSTQKYIFIDNSG